MPYRASLGGQFGGGAGPAPPHVIDIGGAIDAATNGATSLIQNAYNRKVNERRLALEESAQRFNQNMAQQHLDLAKQQQADERLKAGYEAGHGAQAPSAPSADSAIASSFASAGGAPLPMLPADLGTPVAPHFDYSKSLAGQGEHMHESFESVMERARAGDAQALAKLQSGLQLSNEKTLLPLRTNAEISKGLVLGKAGVQNAIETERGTMPDKLKIAEVMAGMKPLSADENTATTQLPMMTDALKSLHTLPGPSARAAMTKSGGFWKNYLNTPEGRLFNQAASQAALSGALATEGPRGAQPDRQKSFLATYAPSAGDDDATAEKKLASLLALTKAVKTKAGRGYQRIPEDQRALIEGALGGEQGAAANPFADLIPGKR